MRFWKRSWFTSLTIKQMLIGSHLVLVLLLISGLSYSRYSYEWQLEVSYAANRARDTLVPHVSYLSTLVAGRNYSNLTLPSLTDTFYADQTLLFLDISGVSDYRSVPVHVRYQRELRQVWREDITKEEIRELTQVRERISILLESVEQEDSSRRVKLDYVLEKAKEDEEEAISSLLARERADVRWSEPELDGDRFYLDETSLELHSIITLRNKGGGRIWAIFDVSELKVIQKELLKDIVSEALIAMVASLLLIVWITQRLILPIKTLSEYMNKDIEMIDINQLPDLDRKDEIGDLANSFLNLITKVKTQMRMLKDQSYIDSLSGLGSRYKYTRYAEQYLRDAMKSNETFGLIICDIDNFKLYNDSYGHAKGDDAITAVAQAIIEATDQQDERYRIGGEEFVVLIKCRSKEKCIETAHRIREGVEILKMPHRMNEPYQVVTVSVGVTVIDPSLYSKVTSRSRLFYKLFNKADQQLYLAKSQGRNKTLSSIYSLQNNTHTG